MNIPTRDELRAQIGTPGEETPCERLEEELHRTRQDLLELQAATRALLNADPVSLTWTPEARAVRAVLVLQRAYYTAPKN